MTQIELATFRISVTESSLCKGCSRLKCLRLSLLELGEYDAVVSIFILITFIRTETFFESDVLHFF